YAPGIPFRRLELLGTGEPEEDEVCSEYLDVIAERGEERAVADAVARALLEGAFGRWDELVLERLDGARAMPHLLATALIARGIPTSVQEMGVAPYIPLPRTWEDYLAELS